MRGNRTAVLTAALAGLTACIDTPTNMDLAESTAAFRADPSDPTPATISLTRIGSYYGGGEGAAEITAFDDVSQRLFVVNGALGTVDVLDLRDPAVPTLVATLEVTAFGASANSVAGHGGIIAVAVEANVKTDPGMVVFYRATTLQVVSAVAVGALPDMLTFTPDGKLVVVANEGEPNHDYSVDPEGSISIIDVRNINAPAVRTAGFGAFNANVLREQGVRIFGPNDPTAAQDLEPEYVTVSDDGRTAFAALQENNALAIIDIATATVTAVKPLGFKHHEAPSNGLDPSDRDGGALIRPWPVYGMYQPDAIAAYSVGGQTFIVSANEGDARDYDTFGEEARVKDLALDPALLELCSAYCPNPTSALDDDENLGRLTVTRTLGDFDDDGDHDALFAFGGRSFSIWTASGQQVFDSGDALEQITKDIAPTLFNASNEDPAEIDNRSDNKGPEPEGVVLGRLGSRTFAFIGLERIGGVIVYDVSDPYDPAFVTYANTRMSHGDLGPEGLAFVPARRSPSKRPLLIVGNEISGTTSIFEIRLH